MLFLPQRLCRHPRTHAPEQLWPPGPLPGLGGDVLIHQRPVQQFLYPHLTGGDTEAKGWKLVSLHPLSRRQRARIRSGWSAGGPVPRVPLRGSLMWPLEGVEPNPPSSEGLEVTRSCRWLEMQMVKG